MRAAVQTLRRSAFPPAMPLNDHLRRRAPKIRRNLRKHDALVQIESRMLHKISNRSLDALEPRRTQLRVPEPDLCIHNPAPIRLRTRAAFHADAHRLLTSMKVRETDARHAIEIEKRLSAVKPASRPFVAGAVIASDPVAVLTALFTDGAGPVALGCADGLARLADYAFDEVRDGGAEDGADATALFE